MAMHGKIRVTSTYPDFGCEYIYHCEPENDIPCETCKFRYKCFTGEEVEVILSHKELEIFSGCQQRKPKPNIAELEIFLFGKEVNLLGYSGWVVNIIPSFREAKYYGLIE